MLTTKQTLKVFLVQVVVFAGLLSIGLGSKYALDQMEAGNKAHIQSLIDKKVESGYEIGKSFQLVMEENPVLIIEMARTTGENRTKVATSSIFIVVVFLFLSAVFISSIFKNKDVTLK